MSRRRYEVLFAPAAARQFRKLAKNVQKRLQPKIDSLATEPLPHGVVKLEGADDFYRVRVGDFRIIYEIRNAELIVLVLTIANRRESYR